MRAHGLGSGTDTARPPRYLQVAVASVVLALLACFWSAEALAQGSEGLPQESPASQETAEPAAASPEPDAGPTADQEPAVEQEPQAGPEPPPEDYTTEPPTQEPAGNPSPASPAPDTDPDPEPQPYPESPTETPQSETPPPGPVDPGPEQPLPEQPLPEQPLLEPQGSPDPGPNVTPPPDAAPAADPAVVDSPPAHSASTPPATQEGPPVQAGPFPVPAPAEPVPQDNPPPAASAPRPSQGSTVPAAEPVGRTVSPEPVARPEPAPAPPAPEALASDAPPPAVLNAAVGPDSGGVASHQERPLPEAGSRIVPPSSDRQTIPTAKAVKMAHDPEDDGVVERLADGLARKAVTLIESFPGRVGGLIEGGVERLAGGLGRAVEGLLGGSGTPSDGLPPAGAFPPPPPPPHAPVSPGFTAGGPSVSGGSGSCGGAAEKLFHGFAVLDPFSVVVPLPEVEIVWLAREPLLPSVAPRPPNARPG